MANDIDLAERLEDGSLRYETFRNGAVFDHVSKHIVKGQRFTPEQARELQRLRQEKRAEAAAQGLVDGTPGLDSKAGSLDAYRKLFEHATAIFHKSQNTRGLAEIGGFITKHADLQPVEPEPEPQVVRHEYDITPAMQETLERLVEMQRAKGKGVYPNRPEDEAARKNFEDRFGWTNGETKEGA